MFEVFEGSRGFVVELVRGQALVFGQQAQFCWKVAAAKEWSPGWVERSRAHCVQSLRWAGCFTQLLTQQDTTN